MTRQMDALSLIVLIATLALFVLVDSPDYPVLLVGFLLMVLLAMVRIRIRSEDSTPASIPLLFEVEPFLEDLENSDWDSMMSSLSHGDLLEYRVEDNYPEISRVTILKKGRPFGQISKRQEIEITPHIQANAIQVLQVAYVSADSGQRRITIIATIRAE